MTLALKLTNICKTFGKEVVLHDLNWDVPTGKVIGLLGCNGAGKSTLLECALGLREVSSGSAILMGESNFNLSESTKQKIAYVPQNSELFEWMTGREMLDYFKAMYSHWNDAKTNKLLKQWKIDANKKIAHLSGGQKQRLSIIRALAHDPELLILDEPVASLDPLGRREFLNELINDVIDRQTTVIFSTHILSDIERIAMDVAFLREGKIVLQGEIDHLLETICKVSGNPVDLHQFLQHPSSNVLRLNNDNNTTEALIQMTSRSMHDCELAHPNLRFAHMNLEDMFIGVTQ